MSAYPTNQFSGPTTSQEQARKFEPFAIVCFILAFLPTFPTFILSIIFGSIGLARVNRNKTRGGVFIAAGLGINTFVNVAVLIWIILLVSTTNTGKAVDGPLFTLPNPGTSQTTVNPAPNKVLAATPEEYVLSVNADTADTVFEIISVAKNDTAYKVGYEDMPVVHHPNDVVKITYTGDDVIIKAYSKDYGNPATDYISWSAKNQSVLTVHGSYAAFQPALDTRNSFTHVYIQ